MISKINTFISNDIQYTIIHYIQFYQLQFNYNQYTILKNNIYIKQTYTRQFYKLESYVFNISMLIIYIFLMSFFKFKFKSSKTTLCLSNTYIGFVTSYSSILYLTLFKIIYILVNVLECLITELYFVIEK